jgi:hypothetical protein
MRKIAFAAILVGAMFALGGRPTLAHEGHGDGNPQQKKMMMNKDDMAAMRRNMHEMMLETHDIMLETIRLVKKTAMDKETTKKAEALEVRMQALIKKHMDMSEKMMKGMGDMPMHDPDMKMENMEKKGK